jgi:hypothetical protein
MFAFKSLRADENLVDSRSSRTRADSACLAWLTCSGSLGSEADVQDGQNGDDVAEVLHACQNSLSVVMIR